MDPSDPSDGRTDDPVPQTDLHVEATYRLTEALVESENRMRRRVDLLSEVVFETDRHGVLVFLNKAWSDATAHPLEACLGRPLQSFVHRDDLARCDQALRAETHETGTRPLIRLQRADDHTIWMELSAARLADGGVVGALHDVTAVHHARQELEAAKERAEQANEAKTQFLATISHEMRTPLNAILGSTELVLEGNDNGQGDSNDPSADVRVHIERVNANAEALLRLITDMLDVSKIEAGQFDLEPAPVELEVCLREALLPIGRQASEKGLDFRLTYDDSLPRRVLTDRDRLRQIVTNLVVNAVKFTDRGSIHVEAARLPPAAGFDLTLELRIIDTGSGIAPDAQARIFERFEQADSSTTRRKGGAGLGLNIVKSLVEALGGTVSVVSQVGQGSEFRVALPLMVPPTAPSPTRVITSQHTTGASGDAGQTRVLVAEDTEANFAVLQIFLTKAGYRVTRAVTGREAVDHASASDVILMDIEMPEMDGLEATRAIRAAEQATGRPAVPILALTAHAIQGYRERCLAAGCTGYLVKPIRRQPLIDAVAAALADRS